MTFTKSLLASTVLMGALATSAYAQTEINWWHAMGGTNGERIDKMAADFNASQSDYVVKPSYKGNYTETMTAAIAAFRAGEQPHLVQVFEVGTATMMAAKGAIYPVEKLMADAGEPFNGDDYLPAVVSYYQTPEGELLSMPFNSSTPVLWYNADALEAAGVEVPGTWEEVDAAAKALVDNGMKCGISFGWQSWVMIENFSAWHDLALGTKENGFAGFDTELTFNNDQVAARLQAVADMQADNKFVYGGRRGDSLPMFTNGECGMWMNSSAYYGSIVGQAKFKFGQTMLPLDKTVADAPQNSIIGGATLWALQGHESDEYKGLAQFLTYLSSPEVQAWWHQETGYVPITKAAAELSKEQGFYESNPGTDTAIKQLSLNTPTANSRGLRFGNFVQIRDVINEEMEALWAGNISAQEALDNAANRGNDLLRKFERSVK
ncbi:sn-glycerol-3-phosphate-binding periplasmic protein UgpB precursor [Pelagimonas phthalicica]|uniref:sn-glycerol-3-phosphate-binding periplasmic protein UgpB n=1 Tax=Pelagimonas phthalicica TaxID=1037362 RepID=A0A238J7P9_9RHOB|nr:sn-glycerol-3-phosphate ABC transporter substrate-binding protein UgpB [Pelagimonas phthalicica]TDS94852.1 carbohydrate ABC transporter substrate-binding protein (CUT1 family) [Pelagimonas phthalicica]SMX26619.1 sn-glycerol-3-phosphate-binding periplasmic protein UgpB precursor [Pelagimonas phthalicica]